MSIYVNGVEQEVGQLPSDSVNSTEIADGSILNVDVSSSAAIEGSKLAGVTRTLHVTNSQQSHTGDTNETTKVTYQLPGGTMGTNGVLRFDIITTNNNSGNNKVIKVKLGATEISSVSSTTTTLARKTFVVANRGSQSSQCFFVTTTSSGVGTASSSLGTASIDTSQNVNITVTVTLANGADSAAIEFFSIELLKV